MRPASPRPAGSVPALLIAVGFLVLLAGARWQRPVSLDAAGGPIEAVEPLTSLTIDVNEASIADLSSLPGIGPGLAERIAENRRRHGRFADPADLQRVPGIGPITIERIERWIRVEERLSDLSD